MEGDPTLDAAAGQVALGSRDRGRVGVDPVDASLGIRARDRNRREPLAAGDVGNACGWIGLQA
jgi:hypothetical protein